ncbi:MAG: hypothetical protein HRU38_13090 [Saccharospirillaceae bacterium]|nr:hypothetical protein [Pseudomonadales bacterium]NRB79579.1 hypothetical protein [Saccharospirillaceae bacterium]
MTSAQLALKFLLDKEQTCEDQDLFIISYIIPIVSLLDQSDNFSDELNQMVLNTIEQDQLDEQDKTEVLSLMSQINQL